MSPSVPPLEPSGAVAPTSRPVRVAGAILVGAILLAYAGSFAGPFVFDDQGAIADNPTLHGLWTALFPPNTGIPVSGRPVANFSFALNYAISGTRVWSYHVVNLLIHAAAALALFGILRRTLIRIFKDARTSLGLAFAISLLWAVHPLQTEAVTYLSQRVESLMGLFYFLTLYCFIRSVTGGSGTGVPPVNLEKARGGLSFPSAGSPQGGMGVPPMGSEKSPLSPVAPPPTTPIASSNSFFGPAAWSVCSVIACLLGMGTKEVMVTAPLLVLLYDYVFVSAGLGTACKARPFYYLALSGTWLLLVVLVVHNGTRGGTAGFDSGVAWWAYGLTQVRAVAHYLRLAFWPHPLVADYWRVLGGDPSALAWDFVLLVFLGVISAVLLRKRSPWGYLGAWFFMVLAPSSSVVPVATEIIAEHRMYLSLAAVLTAVVCAIYFGARALIQRALVKPRFTRIGVGVAFAVVSTSLIAATIDRNRTYRSVFYFWDDVVGKVPENAGAWVNVGNALQQEGDLTGAEACYREALRLVPDYIDAHVNLGNDLVRQKQLPGAIEQYRAVLAHYPTNEAARAGLGLAAYRAGNSQMEAHRMAAAAEFYRIAVEMKPDFPDAHVNYGGTLIELGLKSEAMQQFEAALKLDPSSADIHNNLGGLLAQAGRLPEARIQFEAALKLRPDYREARSNLERVNQLDATRAGP